MSPANQYILKSVAFSIVSCVTMFVAMNLLNLFGSGYSLVQDAITGLFVGGFVGLAMGVLSVEMLKS